MTLNSHIQNILKNSKKDTEWKKEAEERLQARNESKKSGLIATQLAIYMAEKGISQTALGKMTGVSPQQISKVLKGRENLTLATIEKIENALGVELIQVNILEETEVKRLKKNNLNDSIKNMPTYDELIPVYQKSAVMFFDGPGQKGTIKRESSYFEDYYEQIKQKAIERAYARFEKISKMKSSPDFLWHLRNPQEDENEDKQPQDLTIIYG